MAKGLARMELSATRMYAFRKVTEIFQFLIAIKQEVQVFLEITRLRPADTVLGYHVILAVVCLVDLLPLRPSERHPWYQLFAPAMS